MGLNTKLLFALAVVTNNISTSSNYESYELEPGKDNRFCTASLPSRENDMKENQSIIIKYTAVAQHRLKEDFTCTILLNSPRHYEFGLFAVIQKMSLRRNPVSNACIDYVQFGRHKESIVPLYNKRDWETQKLCGNVERLKEARLESSGSPYVVSPFAFMDKQGKLAVKVRISSETLKPDDVVDIEIAVTPFKRCSPSNPEYEACGNGTCILKSFFNDEVINCPFVKCVDEKCAKLADVEMEGIGNTKVAITAVTSIFLSFFLFLGCIMLCRYAELICVGNRTAEHRGTELSQVEPSAPSMTVPLDKDLPPPYESLFPDGTRS